MSYVVERADAESARAVLENTFPEALKVFHRYSPWTDFVSSNLKALEDDDNAYVLFNPEGKPLVLFGIKPGEYNVMWCTPRNDMSERDTVAFLRRGVKKVDEWYSTFGTIFVPVHKDWEAVRELVLFLGFSILDDGGIAVYGDER